jgi:hypothetical protein
VGNGGGGGGRKGGGFRLRSCSRASAERVSALCASHVSSCGALDGLHPHPESELRGTQTEGARTADAGGCTYENRWVGDMNWNSIIVSFSLGSHDEFSCGNATPQHCT